MSMKIKFLLLASLLLLNTSLAFGADPVCSYFYRSLLQLPHTKLIQNSDDFLSLWNGKRLGGCEVVYESHESLVSGSKVYDQFESFIHTLGWSINNNLVADGPGSSTVGIENEMNRCLINWSQHAWIDEKTKEHRQSSQIKMIVQCSPK
jgi:hypothetical protein